MRASTEPASPVRLSPTAAPDSITVTLTVPGLDSLLAPIDGVLAQLGRGVLPPGSVDTVLAAGAQAADAVGSTLRTAVDDVDWSGPAATAAGDLVARAAEAATALARESEALASLAARACEVVARGTAEVGAIASSFVAAATPLLPTAVTPAGAAAVATLADTALAQAAAVAARVRAELDALGGEVAALVPPVVPSLPGPPSLVTDVERFLQRTLDPVPGTPDAGPAESAPGHRAYDPAAGGTGREVVLPDGSTALAPNARAAEAVRFALAQQGTPYVWGGTTPGQGLDCSGLTQSAYGQAGVDLPRLAAEQSVGSPVSVENLMPGDLAVWDGHVAMVVGNGQLVEAGDPVSVSPVRTTNAGMAFHGFYRPTE
ncbi:C40 family peptidase [Rhodococcus sp. NPDC003994]